MGAMKKMQPTASSRGRGQMVRLKASFFDRRAITEAVGRARAKELSKAGSYIRQDAMQSIRKSKKISTPGSPPHSHAGDLKHLIFFSWDSSTRSVVIGPVPFRQGEAPRLLEHGGTATRHKKLVHYTPRPFMGPAMEKNLAEFPDLFRNSITA